MSRMFSGFYNPQILRGNAPLSDDQIRHVAPSIYADQAHESRSMRYSYIPTSDVLAKLREEGFQPFMAAQTRVRQEGKKEHTRHMLRLRHASEVADSESSNEIILINSHDGSSSYQMIAGQFRFVCANGLVCGDLSHEIKIPHKGDVIDKVVAGAFDVLDGFTQVVEERDMMRSLQLNEGEQQALASAAIALRYESSDGLPAPITESDLLMTRRREDRSGDLWTTFNKIQENSIKGGLRGKNAAGKRITTRAVTGIDQSVKLNRALWVLAQKMASLKA